MPSFVIHAMLPLLFLLALPGLDRRKVWWLWPLTFLPDLDYFVPGAFHRATLGNVFILLPFALVLAWHLRPQTRNWARVEWMGLAIVYLGTHLLMDVFAGGSVLLYPFTDRTICYVAAIDVVTATNTPIFWLEACSYDGIPVVSEVYPWLSVTEGAMLAFLLPAWLATAGWTLARRRAAARLRERIR